VLIDLLKLTIHAGDSVLQQHFSESSARAKYTSPQIQNELINICGNIIREKIVSRAQKAIAYSILADESCDISGKEQLSIGVRFSDEATIVYEEFLGFIELKAMDAKTIVNAIDTFIMQQGLDPSKCVGQGYDG
ncbi:PREDICTED: 52 kDa repressor of the inhibitor of the protein kinase-like, partial [Rhagoletis zephyria]|uniref:52 kDa repressor of the inhibitor of the protein kinase-like n=1 Tax=Rhagoletis zephyria TaxID=28612 RepID=UPI0008116368